MRDIDYRYALDGLAIFVNHDFARKFYLPFPVKERVIIDESFATRDLVLTMNRSSRYWVLALSEKPTRLFEGARDTLAEITDYGFPMVHTGPGRRQPPSQPRPDRRPPPQLRGHYEGWASSQEHALKTRVANFAEKLATLVGGRRRPAIQQCTDRRHAA